MKKMKEKLKEKATKKQIIIFISVFLIVSIAFSFYVKKFEPKELDYVKFVEMTSAGEVDKVDLRKDSDNILVYSGKKKYEVSNPKTDTFKEQMLEKGVTVVNKAPVNKVVSSLMGNLFQIGLLVLIAFVLVNLLNTTLKKRNSLVEDIKHTNFNSIAGNVEAKKDMEFLVSFLKSPERYKKMGAKLPKGVVLYGPPGTGKTLMARAVAGEADVPFYYANGSDFIEMYAGLGAKRVRDLFNEAKKNAPCIVFIDEVDAVGSHRGVGNRSTENDQTINALLSELDGFESDDDVIVIIATNRIEDLDSALIRPGRFDRHVSIDLPDAKDRKAILERYSKNKQIDKDVNFENLSKMTIGFSGASLEALMNEAAIIAVNRGFETISLKDIDESYFKIAMKGSSKENRDTDKDEIELVAYHEAGHALATKLLTDNHLHKVTIIPSTSGAGGATFSVPTKMSLLSKKDIWNNIMILYAGRAAEEILRADKDLVTSGASSDIQQATKYINAYFSELGMSTEFGMLAIDKKELYMKEAVALSKKLYSDVLGLLIDNQNLLKKIAEELIEKETISGEEVERLISPEVNQ